MQSMLITGGLFIVVGAFLIKVPLIKGAVGPLLFMTGGLLCVIGLLMK